MNEVVKKVKFRDLLTAATVVGAIVAAAANAYSSWNNASIAATISPLKQDIAVIKTEVLANEKKDDTEHPTFVTKDQYNEVLAQLQEINGRVTQINNNVFNLSRSLLSR